VPGFNRHFQRSLQIGVLSALAAWAPGTPAGTTDATPAETVASAIDDILAAVSSCRFLLATDPASLRELADARARPVLDVLFAGQIILGKWWPEASPGERRAFADSLYGSLANRYAPSLLLLTPGAVTVLAASGATQSDAVVPIVVRVPGYPPVKVALQLRRTGDHWRIYDGRIEDLSPVLQLRDRFSEEIRRDGLARVISRLEAEASRDRSASPATRKCLAAGERS